jgi:ubiquinone/menaquinone biosynthesis C-methylase UbiE
MNARELGPKASSSDPSGAISPSLRELAVWEGQRWQVENDLRLRTFWNDDYLSHIILPRLALGPADHVLDVGCGMGSFSLILAKALSQMKVTGVDLSAPAIEAARSLATEMQLQNVEFRHGSASALPFPEKSFAAVVCQTLLGHVPEPKRVLSEMRRVLRPGGMMLISEWGPSPWSDHAEYPGQGDTTEALKEFQRLWSLNKKGKKELGHGEEVVGHLVPRWVKELDLELIDVRLNDKVQYLVPPIETPRDTSVARDITLSLTDHPRSKAEEDETRALIRLGGGSAEDEEAFLKMSAAAPDAHLRLEALKAHALYNIRLRCTLLTFARRRTEG